MNAEDLRRRVGNAPYTSVMADEDPHMHQFLDRLHDEQCDFGTYAYQVVQDMTDEELLARWARYMIERN